MSRNSWDFQAASFDEEPDHELGDPTTRAAWRDLLGIHKGGGISAAECERLVRGVREHVEVIALPEDVYGGGPITDERYLLVRR